MSETWKHCYSDGRVEEIGVRRNWRWKSHCYCLRDSKACPWATAVDREGGGAADFWKVGSQIVKGHTGA